MVITFVPGFVTVCTVISMAIIVVAVVLVVKYQFSKPSCRIRRNTHHINVNYNYVNELRRKFNKLEFERVKKVAGIYITNPNNIDLRNELRIFVETQVKRIIRGPLGTLVLKTIKNKLSYFSQEEDKDHRKIYKFDYARSLQPGETYAVQNIGHATLLLQIPGFNILTDPVFYDLNNFFYPAKTASYPGIKELPRIDVIVISHNHKDHVDQNSLKELIKYYQGRNWPQPRVFVPLGDKKLLEYFGFHYVEEVEWYTKISVTDGAQKKVSLVSIPADHRSGRTVTDHHKSLVTGWVINPEQANVIFKFSGDTRALSDMNQQATDAVLWNEVNDKKTEKIMLPDIICLEPSSPNYTRCDMNITHQSASYSALLRFIEAKNLAKLSGKNSQEFLQKMQTIMMHHNKFELGPDRFNEGLFVLKKLLIYLDLNQKDLHEELTRQEKKLQKGLDKERFKKSTAFKLRLVIATLPRQTSLLVHAKGFIVRDVLEIMKKLGRIDKKQVKKYIVENTIFPKIGERLNNEQVVSSKFDVENVQKYKQKIPAQ